MSGNTTVGCGHDGYIFDSSTTASHCHHGNTFDAAAWFASWSDAGGIVAMIGDRLWIGRTSCLDREATRQLNSLGGAILHPEAGRAVAGLLRGNRVEAEA